MAPCPPQQGERHAPGFSGMFSGKPRQSVVTHGDDSADDKCRSPQEHVLCLCSRAGRCVPGAREPQ